MYILSSDDGHQWYSKLKALIIFLVIKIFFDNSLNFEGVTNYKPD